MESSAYMQADRKRLRAARLVFAVTITLLLNAAVSAGSATASPHWNVEGKEFKNEALLSNTVSVLSGWVSLKAPGIPIEIQCSSLGLNRGEIKETTKASAASFSFGGCTVPSNSKCAVKAGFGSSAGTILTEALKAELTTVGGTVYLMFRSVGELITTLEVINGSGSCSVAGKYAVKGAAAGKVETGTNAASLGIEFSEALQISSFEKLTIGGKEASLTGKLGLALASGKKWGVGL